MKNKKGQPIRVVFGMDRIGCPGCMNNQLALHSADTKVTITFDTTKP